MILHAHFLDFRHGSSFLHKADPRIKLCCILAWQYLIWHTTPLGILQILATTVILHLICRLHLLRTLAAMRAIIFLALLALLIPLIGALYRAAISTSGITPPIGAIIVRSVLRNNGLYALRLLSTAFIIHLCIATTTISSWVHAIEWFVPLPTIRAIVGLLVAMALNYLIIIQQYHHQLIHSIRARTSSRMTLTTIRHYCSALVLLCVRFADRSTIAISARKFSYQRTRPTFRISIPHNATLIAITLFLIVTLLFQ